MIACYKDEVCLLMKMRNECKSVNQSINQSINQSVNAMDNWMLDGWMDGQMSFLGGKNKSIIQLIG